MNFRILRLRGPKLISDTRLSRSVRSHFIYAGDSSTCPSRLQCCAPIRLGFVNIRAVAWENGKMRRDPQISSPQQHSIPEAQ